MSRPAKRAARYGKPSRTPRRQTSSIPARSYWCAWNTGRGIEQSRRLHVLGRVEDEIERVAWELVGQYGPDAPRYVLERAEQAEAVGDWRSAKEWRDIADAAERLLRSWSPT